MTTTFHGLDNEFAVSTGSNVNSSPGRSDFDYPPQSSKDLVVTSNAGDPNPNRFEVGETYDVSFGGNGAQGGTTLEDAVVIRSDYAPGGTGGIVVFEGTNAGGDTVQVVWTPDFDLEGWYYDNFSGGNPPQFYTTDQQPATFEFVCFAPDTAIRTPHGDRPAGSLRAGDMVTTLDRGAQPLIWTGRRTLRFPPSPDTQKPVLLAAGALAPGVPRADLVISPQHRLLGTAPATAADAPAGARREVLVKAKSLLARPGIRVMRGKREITYVTLLLARHHVLFAEDAAVESFYPGRYALTLLSPSQRAQIAVVLPRLQDDPAGVFGPLARPEVAHQAAKRLVASGDIRFAGHARPAAPPGPARNPAAIDAGAADRRLPPGRCPVPSGWRWPDRHRPAGLATI